MMAILSYMQLFTFAFVSIILFLFPGIITYKTYVLIITGVSMGCLIGVLSKYKINYLKPFLVFVVCLILLSFYYLTSLLYATDNEKYNSFLLVLVGQMIPTAVCSSICCQIEDIQKRMEMLAPIVAILFTLISFVAAFFPNSQTSGGFASTDYGLNYQVTSYIAANAASFSYYYLINYSYLGRGTSTRKRKLLTMMKICLFVNFLTILIAGGRGALVLFIIHTCYAICISCKNRIVDLRNIGKLATYLFLGLLLVVTGILYALQSSVKTNGFGRILAMIENHDQNGRDVLRTEAIRCFTQEPLWGHGLGAVYYEIGEYSHNMFTDVAVEMGCLGLLLLVMILFIVLKKLNYLISLDISNSFLSFIFLNGLGMAFFSGYYLANVSLWWATIFVIFKCGNSSKEVYFNND